MKIYEVVETTQAFCVISELLSGGELFEKILNEKNFSESTAAGYMYDILLALSYLHKCGIVHRDLKPENILFETQEGTNIKIIDFGVSTTLKPDGSLHGITGTELYIAPEVLLGHYNEKCDVWSAGVILYLMLCTFHSAGCIPFYGETEEAIKESILKSRVKFQGHVWAQVSSEAKSLVKQMLEKNPKKRLSAAQAVTHKWVTQNTKNSEKQINFTVLKNLATFHGSMKIQKAILNYISYQILSTAEQSELIRVFKELDTNNDGSITRDELLGAYEAVGMSADIDRIMEVCDTDHSGSINFTEFITAAQNWKQLLEKDLLLKTFKESADSQGEITISELQREIPGIQQSEWNSLNTETGRISIEQLKNYLINNN